MVSRISDRIIAARRSERGFTLIELLVVIIILGILAAVVVFAVSGVGDKGKSAADSIDVRTLRTAEEAHRAQQGSFGTEDELVSNGFLSEESENHGIVVIGEPGPDQTFIITCDAAEGCGDDGSLLANGTLRVTGGADVSGANFVNPASTTSGGAHNSTEFMFNGLLRWASNGTAQPDLAESFTISPNQQTATFTLRPGLKWHDGEAITAEDVDFTYRNALIKYHGRTQGSMGPAFGIAPPFGASTVLPAGGITYGPDPDGAGPLEPKDGLVVQFNFVTPYAPLLRQMNVTEAPIIPQHVYQACATAGTLNAATCAQNNPGAGDLIATNAVRPIGSGPFMIKTRDTTAHNLVLVKNLNYHHAGLPLAGELLVFQGPVTESGANQLQANATDVATVPGNRLPPFTGPTIISGPAFETAGVPRGTGGGNCVLTWGFNLWQKNKTPGQIQSDIAANPNIRGDHPIFGDPTLVDPDGAGPLGNMPRGLVVRKAITMALNRQALFDNVEFGKGQVATSAYHSKLAPYTAQPIPGFDLTTADTWLDNAGWSDANNPRQSTGAVGMPTAGTPLTFNMHGFSTGTQGTYFTQISQQLAAAPTNIQVTSIQTTGGPGPVFGTRPWDSTLFSVCQGDDPVIGARRTIHSSQISSAAFTNMSGYYNPAVDTLFNNAFGASYTGNHQAIQAQVVADAPMVWISETLNVRAWRNNCGGFNNENTGLFVETGSCS